MDGFGDLRALTLDLNLQAHGVAITVTTPTGEAVTGIRGIWLTPISDGWPGGLDLQRTAPKRILAVRRTDVPSLPRGTAIVAPEQAGGTDRGWRVEGVERIDADHHRAVVVLDPTADLLVTEA